MSVETDLAKGSVIWMDTEIRIGRGALVPREEGELLARTAIAELASEDGAGAAFHPRIIDMCCGVGNFACVLARRFPTAQVWACDLTDSCVALARENVRRFDLTGRVQVVQGDLFGGLAGRGLENSIDLVVSNPPYISQKRLEGESAGLLDHEPIEAFDGGPYGLTIHQRVIRECVSLLRPGGRLLFEVGLGQAVQVAMLFKRARIWGEARLVNDPAGNPRVVHAQRRAD
jgi:HemK-like putative methylase